MKPDATTSRYLRLKQIIGDQKSSPELEPLLPISASSWWAGVAEGRFPKPVKLGPNTTAWRWEDIQSLLAHLAETPDRCTPLMPCQMRYLVSNRYSLHTPKPTAGFASRGLLPRVERKKEEHAL